jgi:hypothetical protein
MSTRSIPSSARRFANAAPIPSEAPATRAVLPYFCLRLIIGIKIKDKSQKTKGNVLCIIGDVI